MPTREAELLHELSSAHEVTATVPYHPGHVTDLRGLLDVGAGIWGDEVVTATGEPGSRNRAGPDSPVPRAPRRRSTARSTGDRASGEAGLDAGD